MMSGRRCTERKWKRRRAGDFMSEIISLRIENDRTEEFIEAMKEQIEAALEDIGIDAEGYAKTYIEADPNRVDTGRLRNSITHSTQQKPASYGYTWEKGKKSGRAGGSDTTSSHGGEEELAVYIGTNVEYAAYVEMGTINMAANHFLRNALANHKDEYKEDIENALKGK